jgi:hypothetical protein
MQNCRAESSANIVCDSIGNKWCWKQLISLTYSFQVAIIGNLSNQWTPKCFKRRGTDDDLCESATKLSEHCNTEMSKENRRQGWTDGNILKGVVLGTPKLVVAGGLYFWVGFVGFSCRSFFSVKLMLFKRGCSQEETRILSSPHKVRLESCMCEGFGSIVLSW